MTFLVDETGEVSCSACGEYGRRVVSMAAHTGYFCGPCLVSAADGLPFRPRCPGCGHRRGTERAGCDLHPNRDDDGNVIDPDLVG
jgi:hypothetical protein